MKTLFLLLAVLALPGASFAADAGKITVEMSGFQNDKGFAMVALFSAAEGFPKKSEKACMRAKVQVTQGKAAAVFENAPYGRYAVSMFHDENASGKLDTNFFGVPKEGWGVSNNAAGTFGPKFDDASFILASTQAVVNILVKY